MSYVYRCFSEDGTLLYVGLTDNVNRRMYQHAHRAPWWKQVSEIQSTVYADRGSALKAEARAILDERPTYNRTEPPSWLSAERAPAIRSAWEPVGDPHLVPISEAKAKLAELLRDSDEGDVILLKHGRPAAIMLSARRHEAMLEEIEDLKDRLSIHEREGLTMNLDKVMAELGL